MAIACGDAAHYSQLALDGLREAKRLKVDSGRTVDYKIETNKTRVAKYVPLKGVHTKYAKELSTVMATRDVRATKDTANKCKDDAKRTGAAVWGAILYYYDHMFSHPSYDPLN